MKMIRSHVARLAPLYTVGVASIAILGAARYSIGSEGFDWPAWVQAVGSIAAILVASWIADRDARVRRYEANIVAMVAATEIGQAVETLSHSVEDMSRSLDDLENSRVPFAQVQSIGSQLDVIRAWTVSEIAQLAPLQGRAAMHIALAQSQLAEAKFDILRITKTPDLFSSHEHRSDVRFQLQFRLNEAQRNLLCARRDMRLAQDALSTSTHSAP